MDFNKKLFADLLKDAKGNRSINKYGIDSKVDPGYISRLMRELIDYPPSPDVINKLAEKAYNDITSFDFMKAAGHIDSDLLERAQTAPVGTTLVKMSTGEILDLNQLPPPIRDVLEAQIATVIEKYKK